MNQLNNTTYTVNTYGVMPSIIEIPVIDYKATIDSFIAKYGVRWVYHKKVVDKEPTEGSAPKRRKTVFRYVWYINYFCHRSGTKRVKSFVNQTGKQRNLQKETKKQNCPARLKVVCYQNNPSIAVFEHNHEIGGLDDIKHLPLSNEARAYIEGRLNEGYRKRDTRLSIQKNYRIFMQNLSIDMSRSSTVVHKDQMVHADEISLGGSRFKKQKRTVNKSTDTLAPPPSPSASAPPPPPPPGGETAPTNENPQHGYFSRKCKIPTLLRNDFRSYKQLFREIAEKHSLIRKDAFDFALFLCLNHLTNE
ncbi:hypothetical protein MFLAVUS_001010 [Mucor flavus]|uniref:FAR1 domain-containing protein n=1 Tax=Mucor flavus TaxID=439312 RepID=A0ABP9YLA7_9FUNG